MIKHIGNNPQRRNIWNPAEVVYAEKWEKENKNVYGLNRGCGYLELLLNQSNFNDYVDPISQRDAFVAATVIQWLGTNIGSCFLQECEKKIKEDKPKYKIAQEMIMRLKGSTPKF